MTQSEFYHLVEREHTINSPNQTKVTFLDNTYVCGFFVTLPDDNVEKEEFEWLFVPAINAIAFGKEPSQLYTKTINGEDVLSLETV